jgi:hypothetical protein
MIDPLWAMLRELVREEVSDQKWEAFRRSVEGGAGFHYGFKTGDRRHFGPFGLLVREMLLVPEATSSHDYLGCPEIVEDIACCFQSAHDIDLKGRFYDESKPCIVKFRGTEPQSEVIKAALWYAFSKLRVGEVTWNADSSFDGEGQAIPPQDIVEVEVIGSVTE